MVEWNLTHTSLDRAGCPENQFLDCLPDASTPWIYKPVVQLSAVFLAVCIFVTLLIIVGIGRYVLFKIIHPEPHSPQSKLYWLLQMLKNPGSEGFLLSGGQGESERLERAGYRFRDVLGEKRNPRDKVSEGSSIQIFIKVNDSPTALIQAFPFMAITRSGILIRL